MILVQKCSSVSDTVREAQVRDVNIVIVKRSFQDLNLVISTKNKNIFGSYTLNFMKHLCKRCSRQNI